MSHFEIKINTTFSIGTITKLYIFFKVTFSSLKLNPGFRILITITFSIEMKREKPEEYRPKSLPKAF